MTEAQKGTRTLSCPACGGTLEVRAAGWSVNLACRYCGSILDVSRPEVQIIERHKRAAGQFSLPLGARGSLFDTEWEVIGAMIRRGPTDRWREYLLFNPYVGYRWLVEWEGEWQFGTPLLDRPEAKGDSVVWRSQRFRQEDDESEAVTGSLVGEFYWRVAQGDSARARSYVARDFMLSCEEAGGEINWTQLVALSEGHVETAFGIVPPRMSRERQSALYARGGNTRKPDDLGRICLLVLASAILALLAMIVIAGPVERVSGTVTAPFGSAREGQKIGAITVRRAWQFVTVTASGENFDNRWIELDYRLVDRTTGQSIDGYGLSEHYSGSDSDGAWTEGSRSASTLFGQVPRGTYDLYVDAAAHSWPVDTVPDGSNPWSTPEAIEIRIDARTGSLPWGNWWTLVILLSIYPCVLVWRRFRNQNS
ncbi:MAG: DUF4178 domain-containing protein [Novosphingobium sp.]|nr:DUF4178 domain-containing protein [Novosphingobium sp.]